MLSAQSAGNYTYDGNGNTLTSLPGRKHHNLQQGWRQLQRMGFGLLAAA